MKRSAIAALAVFSLGVAICEATAADAYFVKPIRDLEVTSGEIPEDFENTLYDWRTMARWEAMHPWGALEGEGEIYLNGRFSQTNFRNPGAETPIIAVRAAAGRDVRGRLFLPKPDGSGFATIGFRLPAGSAAADRTPEYLEVKRAHYQGLFQRDIPGSAWFRYQLRETTRQLGMPTDELNNQGTLFGRRRGNDLEDSFALFSGGRALSENLQLDRMLPTAAPTEDRVAVDSIEGITVRAFDWTPLVKDIHPELDPLAALIPHDQHALFLPSFTALVELIDRARERGTLILRMGDPRAEDAGAYEFYQRQLCLPLGQLERLIGQHLIASMAITGGDPYFRSGTDVAVLFEAKNVQALRTALDSRIALTGRERAQPTALSGEILGVAYSGLRSADREICCYIATLGNAVVVTNSPRQLERVIRTQHGDARSLASLGEYRFFRQRYLRADAGETALLVISDDTIRRWCGPRWRIAASRRTRAVAVMSDLQAQYAERLVRGDVRDTQATPEYWLPEVKELTIAASGVSSTVYGTMAFQTPISELNFDRVTQPEADFYNRWRMGYQGNWRNFFDPIAVRFSIGAQELGADLTVLPLIDASQYRWMSEISRGVKLQPDAADWHPSVLQWALALNTESQLVQQAAGFAQSLAPQIRVNPLSWVGSAISIYADHDPYWADLAQARPQTDAELEQFFKQNAHRLPVALHVHVKSGIKLTAFLVGVRAFIEQSSPGLTSWETREHNGQAYVRISPSPQALSDSDGLEKVSVFYVPSGDSLIVTLSEEVLKRAIDRQVARRNAKPGDAPPTEVAPAASGPLGDSIGLAAEGHVVDLFHALFRQQLEYVMQARAWGNIPILNEWKRRFPDQSPVATHQRLWNRLLVCPGGGEYRWNEEWQTMESTVYGHPGAPKSGPGLPSQLRDVAKGNFGLTFENQGLRSQLKLQLKSVETAK